MLTLTLAYLLMLIAMEFYAGHFIAIIIGFGSGHYLFNSTPASFDFLDPHRTSSPILLDQEHLQKSTNKRSNVNYDEI